MKKLLILLLPINALIVSLLLLSTAHAKDTKFAVWGSFGRYGYPNQSQPGMIAGWGAGVALDGSRKSTLGYRLRVQHHIFEGSNQLSRISALATLGGRPNYSNFYAQSLGIGVAAASNYGGFSQFPSSSFLTGVLFDVKFKLPSSGDDLMPIFLTMDVTPLFPASGPTLIVAEMGLGWDF